MDTGSPSHRDGLTRRDLLKATAAGGAALLTGGSASLLEAQVGDESAPYIEASIRQLQLLMTSGRLTSRELTQAYLRRIDRLNPLLGAVIETNPNAVAIAVHLDNERRKGHTRGPLHGIPILVKDNIATDDNMETTAGSLALVGSQVPRDATVVRRLRDAGAVILGKANLSEWANFRGFAPFDWGFGPFNGWSARGGFTRDPYVLSFDPCGSSTGSAVGPAANLCAAAVGTETDGSIVCPSGNNFVVGLKPTLGLVAQDGIIPIAHSQDTAGPMARTVVDVAILLGALQSPFIDTPGRLPTDYTAFLRRRTLRGARIGVDARYFDEAADLSDPSAIPVVEAALEVMRELGATLVRTDTGDPLEYAEAEFTVLLYEFKGDIAAYLAELRHTRLRTLADLIAFNVANCRREMKYFGQEIFELSQATSGNLRDREYVEARRQCLRLSRGGIDGALARDRLDAIVAPTYSFSTTPPAVSGYPNLSVPAGLRPDGSPVGLSLYAGPFQEAKLLALAYDLEQELQARRPPRFLGRVLPEPPDAGLCGAAKAAQRVDADRKGQWHHLGTGKRLVPGG